MKQKKILFMAMIALLLIILNAGFVNAESSVTVAIDPDVTNVKPGETVDFKVSLTQVNSEKAGFSALQGTLVYDKEVFEELTSNEDGECEQITGLNGWNDPTYNAQNGKIVLEVSKLSNSVKANDTEIIKISLKVKEEATIGKKGTIMLEDLKIAEKPNNPNDEDVTMIETSPATASVTIAEEGATVIIPQTTPSPTASTKPTSPSPVSPPKTTTQPSKLPQTGISNNPVPVLFGALVVVLISYVVYRRYKEI